MTTTATHNEYDTTTERVLFMACALREKTWKLGCTTGHGHKPRERTIAARHQARVLQEIAQAKREVGRVGQVPSVDAEANLTGSLNREGPSVYATARHRDQGVLIVGEGIFCLARLQAPS